MLGTCFILSISGAPSQIWGFILWDEVSLQFDFNVKTNLYPEAVAEGCEASQES